MIKYLYFNKSGKMNWKIFFIYFSAFIFFVLDRFLKFLAINHYFNNPINVVGNFFRLNFAKNYNIAFSIPFSGVMLNLSIATILLILICLLIFLFKKKKFYTAGYLMFIILGAISNFADRIRFDCVTDYFDLKYFTVFNIADVMIVGGAMFLIIKKDNKNCLL